LKVFVRKAIGPGKSFSPEEGVQRNATSERETSAATIPQR
jgi:hypothetical protein